VSSALTATLPEREIVLPYLPRAHFFSLHASQKRWKLVVAHRRAGKTVALANVLIRAALTNPRITPPPRYAYIGPSFDQTKDLVWSYLKEYTANVPDVRYLEGELTVVFARGQTIRLYGGALAYERMRGIYLDGCVLDEYPLLAPQAFTSVVRPCLADYGGFAIVSGTSAGDDHFHQLKLRAEVDPNWDLFDIKITDTGEAALTAGEVGEMRRDMSADEFAREMLNSFAAPLEGAYYSEAFNNLASQNRITKVSADLNAGVFTAWDLGIADFQCVWLGQLAGRELHWLDYLEQRGRPLSFYASELASRAAKGSFTYRAHLLPHDVEVRELTTGESRRQELSRLLTEPVLTVPRHSPEDGIAAVRGVLGVSWFDAEKCRRGLDRLRSYRRGKTGQPVHDDASHGADAFRTACVGLPLISGSFLSTSGAGGRLRRRLRGLV
jgi:phage terminase large subunit